MIARFRRGAALGLLLWLAACGDESTAPGGEVVGELEKAGGDLQEGVAGRELEEVLTVRVVGTSGRPVGGVVVNFHVVAGGGQVFAGSSTTSRDGLARERWVLGTSTADEQRVEARVVDNASGAFITTTFGATALPDEPARMEAVDGDGQDGPLGAPLGDSVAVRVVDRHGNPVPGVDVGWEVASGGGAASPATARTGASGVARAQWVLGADWGAAQSAVATAAGLDPVPFSATASLPATAVVTKVAGDARSATVGARLPESLEVRVHLPDGRPLAGVPVAWSTAPGSGTIEPAALMTGASGLVEAEWRAGTAAGEQSVTVTVEGLPPVVFRATAVPDAPVDIDRAEGLGQTGSAGGALPDSLAVVVRDRFGNPVPGVDVTWTIRAGGGSVTPGARPTDAAGTARARWVIGTRLDEPQQVDAGVAGLGSVTFAATAAVGGASRLGVVSGDSQADSVDARLAAPLLVRAELADGRPLAGVAVAWSTSPGAGSVSPATSTTDASGLASAVWTLGEEAGEATVNATSPGLAPATFRATVVPGAPTGIERLAGDGQRGAVGGALPDSASVRVRDRHGNPVAGALVRWTSAAEGAQVRVAGDRSRSGGIATASWTLGRVAGPQALEARLESGAPVTFTATALVGPPHAIVFAREVGGTTLRSHSVATPPAVRVTDLYGNAISGARVAWAAASGSRVTPLESVTDTGGEATPERWTLGNTAGDYVLTATTPGLHPVSTTALAEEGSSIARWAFEYGPGVVMLDVWGASPRAMFAVGAGGTLLHYDGVWTRVPLGITHTLYGVWGSSATDVYAVGGSSIFHFDGAAWTQVAHGTGATGLIDVWGTSATDVYAVSTGMVIHFDGSAWTPVNLPAGATGYNEVWGSSAHDVWVTGAGAGGFLLRFDGGTWSRVDLGSAGLPSTSFPLTSIWGSSPSDVYVAATTEMGWPGTAVLLHWNGSSWSRAAIDPSGLLSKAGPIWGSSASDVYFLGQVEDRRNGWYYPWLYHFDGSAWTGSLPPSTFHGLWGFGPNHVVGVGNGLNARTVP